MAPKIAIVYYSMYGHIRQLAEAEKKGIEKAGGTADIFQVAETLPEEVLTKMHAPPKPTDIPVITDPTVLEEYDAFLLGVPTRFGNFPAQWKAFWDKTGKQWASGGFHGKFAGVFVSTASQGGGQESTVIACMSTLAHHGIIYVPLGYAKAFGILTDLNEARGGSPWGAGTFAGGDGSRQPSANELELATIQGENFYQTVAKYVEDESSSGVANEGSEGVQGKVNSAVEQKKAATEQTKGPEKQTQSPGPTEKAEVKAKEKKGPKEGPCLEAGQFTSVDLVNAYIARINEVNSTLRVVTQINPDALSIAADLDVERAEGKNRGPLHGIPILLKDSIATADKLETTVGSYALLGARVPKDSTVAAKLRKAGAIILGKTNMSQWANFRSVNSSNGWSSIAGQTEGAYYPEQDPSGSSSGSAVASSLGLAAAALGTETDGSIISPANCNNIVGIKPTVGLTSRYLVVPISEHQDTIGTMARSVKDAAYLLSAIAGPDPKDNYTSAIPFSTIPDYVSACDLNALSGKRIGVPRALIDTTSPHFTPLLAAFNTTLSSSAPPTPPSSTPRLHLQPPAVPLLLTTNPHNLTTLPDVRKFIHTHGVLESYPERDTALWDTPPPRPHTPQRQPDLLRPLVLAQLHHRSLLAGPHGLTGALANHSLDALVIPAEWASTLPAVLGSPVVTVPMGSWPRARPW
ncbi:hypothetical protein N0V88_004227 [Collariella sp. IMI 366227]|nr:hypothetical protein N0V88_004227 [Collariella sp. IMI 366227]